MQSDTQSVPNDLSGMMLVAMPGMPDERFAKSVIFLCSYDDQGAMGLIVNQLKDELTLDAVFEQLEVDCTADLSDTPVHCGGPVESGRGFVLHSSDYRHASSLVIGERFALTATMDILQAIASGNGPERVIFALGYAGWSPGQLDREIRQNGWLLTPANERVVFELDTADQWQGALAVLGIDPSLLAASAGHA